MGSESSRPTAPTPHRSRQKPLISSSSSAASHRRRRRATAPMGPAACLIEWLKPDCLNPDKPRKTRSKKPTSGGRPPSAAAAGISSLTLEEHLSTSSPLIVSGQTVPARFPNPQGSRRPSPKRIHPSSSSSAAAGGGKRRSRKVKNKSFTLETLVKLDRESRDDYNFGGGGGSGDRRSKSVNTSRGYEYDVGSSSGAPAGSQSCSRDVMKKAKSVRFTLPGDGDVFVFYSPKAAVVDDRPFHSL